jgi:glycosyltransferase involved in cell wall biosynthesis
MTSARPKVSVLMLAYNHERHVEQAVQSALMQRTDFDYEIVIGEDCSTDRTREIVSRLADQHPDRIRLLPREGNLGVGRNFSETYQACAGQYIALLEGDDYWTDPQKLQKQAGALDRDPHCAICFHPVRYVDELGRHLDKVHPTGVPRVTTINNLLNDNYIQTCSILLRKSALPTLPSWVEELRVLDWPLCVLAADTGHIVQLDDIMAEYRVHAGGNWSPASLIQKRQAIIEVFERLAVHFHPSHQRQIFTLLGYYYCDLSREIERSGEHEAASRNLARALEYYLRALEGAMPLSAALLQVVGQLVPHLTEDYKCPGSLGLRAQLSAIRSPRTWRLRNMVRLVLALPQSVIARLTRRKVAGPFLDEHD